MNAFSPGKPPLVAIVGRPNVGKSTLFNRLAGRRIAVIHRESGTTRDRLYADVEWGGEHFQLVDTGGLLPNGAEGIEAKVVRQVKLAIQEASICLLVVDVQKGLTPLDEEVARLLRRMGKPVVVAVNKVDNADLALGKSDFLRLGFETCLPVSALHGLGSGDILDVIARKVPFPFLGPRPNKIAVAIIGRPNVGKSTLINRLVGEERVLVDETPGTTRDAVDVALKWKGKELMLIDTAGLQKKSDSQSALTRFGLNRAHRSIARADIVFLVLEAGQEPTRVDSNLIRLAISKGKGCVIGINKWDLVETSARRRYRGQIRHCFAFAGFLPVFSFSALKDRSPQKVLETVMYVAEQRGQTVRTGILNRVLQQAQERVSAPRERGKKFKIFYATQVGNAPPVFRLFVNNRRILSSNYEQYLFNCLRRVFGFEGTPLRFEFREKRGRR